MLAKVSHKSSSINSLITDCTSDPSLSSKSGNYWGSKSSPSLNTSMLRPFIFMLSFSRCDICPVRPVLGVDPDSFSRSPVLFSKFEKSNFCRFEKSGVFFSGSRSGITIFSSFLLLVYSLAILSLSNFSDFISARFYYFSLIVCSCSS